MIYTNAYSYIVKLSSGHLSRGGEKKKNVNISDFKVTNVHIYSAPLQVHN